MLQKIFVLSILILLPGITHSKSEFCIVGDTGTGKRDQYKVSEAMESQSCKNILHTGDVIYPRGASSSKSKEWKRKFEKPYKNLIEKGSVFFISLGNHDHQAGSQREVTEAYSQYSMDNSAFYFPSNTYMFRDDNVCIWALDTDEFSRSQAKALRKSLEETKDCNWKVAFGHHPIKSSGRHGNAKRKLRNRLRPTLEKHIDIYAAGHDHNLADEGWVGKDSRGHFRQLVSGAGAKLRRVKKCKKTGCLMAESTLGFSKVIFDQRKVDIYFYDSEGDEIYSATIEKDELKQQNRQLAI